MIQAHFKGIKDLLIENIDRASSEINIAVAWFTQRELFDAVIKAMERGVHVSLVLMDDLINRNEYGLDFALFISKGGKLCLVNNKMILMHDKFCLLDRKVLFTGSYNWTCSAENRNTENIICTDDTKVCDSFKSHFEQIWSNLSEAKEFSHMKVSDSNGRDFVNNYDALYNEY